MLCKTDFGSKTYDICYKIKIISKIITKIVDKFKIVCYTYRRKRVGVQALDTLENSQS